jgi:hypothetical protein
MTVCPSVSGVVDVSTWLGRRQAFGMISRGVSAGDVQCLRQIRDGQLYKSKTSSWSKFCLHYLGASKAHVNRVLQCLDEFGPSYFALTQLARIPPEVYRTIAPHVTNDGILLDGTLVPLTAENARQVSDAVAELRRRAEPENDSPDEGSFAALVRSLGELVGLINAVRPPLDLHQKASLGALLAKLRDSALDLGVTEPRPPGSNLPGR